MKRISAKITKKRSLASKTDFSQTSFNLPASQLSLSLDQTEPLQLPRRPENRWPVDKYWLEFVRNSKILKKLAVNQPLRTRPGYGLIYIYLINRKVRYIGKTAYGSLIFRLRQKFKNNLVGYHYDIKRCLLNAFWAGQLEIRTEVVALNEINQRETGLINLYARLNRLWNQKHNPYFQQSNFDY